jgi:alkylated DNA repair dioxygenase AlkB
MDHLQRSLDLEVVEPVALERGVLPRGLRVVRDYITPSQEDVLTRTIDAQPWLTSMNRRVQHYGWRYDYRARRVRADAFLGPLPRFLDELTNRLRTTDELAPDQAIVNEYQPGQGIAPHVDCKPCFGDRVAMVALGSDVQLDFANPSDGLKGSILFSRRALVTLEDEARWSWTHGIAKRRSDSEYRVKRDRRLSITFRTIVQAGNPAPNALHI